MRAGSSVILVMAIALTGCRSASRAPQLDDLLGSLIDQAGYSAGERIEFAAVSPIVVLATVESNEQVGSPVEARRVRGYRVQLQKVSARVEEALRRDTRDGLKQDVAFYYFAAAEPRAYQPYHKFFYKAAASGRYLFFLCATERHCVPSAMLVIIQFLSKWAARSTFERRKVVRIPRLGDSAFSG